MKKTLLMLSLALLLHQHSNNSTKKTPIKYNTSTILSILKTDNIVTTKTTIILKTSTWTYKDRKQVGMLFRKLVLANKEFKTLANTYSLNYRQLASVITTIAVSESSTSHGAPFANNLWQRNNPFGIKGMGIRTPTVEYYGGQRYEVVCSFQSYTTVDNAISTLLQLWESDRYLTIHTTASPLTFFKELYNVGYYTNKEYYKVFYQIYLTIIN